MILWVKRIPGLVVGGRQRGCKRVNHNLKCERFGFGSNDGYLVGQWNSIRFHSLGFLTLNGSLHWSMLNCLVICGHFDSRMTLSVLWMILSRGYKGKCNDVLSMKRKREGDEHPHPFFGKNQYLDKLSCVWGVVRLHSLHRHPRFDAVAQINYSTPTLSTHSSHNKHELFVKLFSSLSILRLEKKTSIVGDFLRWETFGRISRKSIKSKVRPSKNRLVLWFPTLWLLKSRKGGKD